MSVINTGQSPNGWAFPKSTRTGRSQSPLDLLALGLDLCLSRAIRSFTRSRQARFDPLEGALRRVGLVLGNEDLPAGAVLFNGREIPAPPYGVRE